MSSKEQSILNNFVILAESVELPCLSFPPAVSVERVGVCVPRLQDFVHVLNDQVV